ncbi:MAG: HD domain-containing protein [Provencibacterium sp.]|nr:HD domain-containing protein [Provencibacterium sp.]
MKASDYARIERYMQSCMADSAHDKEHIYRVLYTALDIAGQESGVNLDILITACLLHDIGRQEQFENPRLCHAAAGAEKARAFLLESGFSSDFAGEVAACIRSHRYRADNPCRSIEAKVLFDADKIDVSGALGIARSLLYIGQVGEPLYSFRENGEILDGTDAGAPSFFREYKFKLETLYTHFFTRRGAEIACQRQQTAKTFYEDMLKEATESYRMKAKLWGEILE